MEATISTPQVKQAWLQVAIFITLFAGSWINALLTLPDKHVIMFGVIEAIMPLIVRYCAIEALKERYPNTPFYFGVAPVISVIWWIGVQLMFEMPALMIYDDKKFSLLGFGAGLVGLIMYLVTAIIPIEKDE